MQIAGMQKSSMADYPGHISIVVFTPYCNYDCFYCHNRSILNNPVVLDTESIMDFVKKRAKMIDALVISGGEPTLQKGLIEFTRKIKDLGYLVKLDTNGSNLNIIRQLVDNQLIDFIAIDLKCPFNRYEEICRNSDGEAVKESINFVVNSSIDYDIRTTMVPQITSNEMLDTLRELPRLKKYTIQQYKKPESALKEDLFRVNAKPHSKEYLQNYADKCMKICDSVILKA